MIDDPLLPPRKILDRLREIVAEPDKWCSTDVEYVDDAADLIEELLIHRNVLRREVCRQRASYIQGKTPFEIADALGWDCFKESRHA